MRTANSRLLLSVTLAALVAGSAHASTIELDGTTYHVVDWVTIDPSGDVATGTAGPVSITFEPFALQGTETPYTGDYASDAAYDALTFIGGSTLESLNIQGHGGSSGDGQSDVVTFSQAVSSLLILVGLPSSTDTGDNFGTSVWDFADELGVSIVDTEQLNGTTALVVSAGNLVGNPVTPIAGNHSHGVIRVNGAALTSLDWTHVGSGTDSLRITFAVALPEPAAALLWLPGLAALAAARSRGR